MTRRKPSVNERIIAADSAIRRLEAELYGLLEQQERMEEAAIDEALARGVPYFPPETLH